MPSPCPLPVGEGNGLTRRRKARRESVLAHTLRRGKSYRQKQYPECVYAYSILVAQNSVQSVQFCPKVSNSPACRTVHQSRTQKAIGKRGRAITSESNLLRWHCRKMDLR